MTVTVYGISSCGTVKKARQWLDAHGLTYTWVDFRQDPPEPERVARWLAAFGSKPLRNTSGGAYRALPEDKATWGDREWLPRFQADPMLLKRPVVEIDGKPAAVGFKESDYAGLFGV